MALRFDAANDSIAPIITDSALTTEVLDDPGLELVWADARDSLWERAMLSGLTWYVARAVTAHADGYKESLTMVASMADNPDSLLAGADDIDPLLNDCASSLRWDLQRRGERPVVGELYSPRLFMPLPTYPLMFVMRRYVSVDAATYRSRYFLDHA